MDRPWAFYTWFFSTTSSCTFICATQHWCIILWSYEQQVLELSQQRASHFLSNFNQKYQEGGGGSGWGGIDSFLTAVLLVTAVFTVLRVITPPRVIHTAPIRAPELIAETRLLLVLHRLHTWNTISRSLHSHTCIHDGTQEFTLSDLSIHSNKYKTKKMCIFSCRSVSHWCNKVVCYRV